MTTLKREFEKRLEFRKMDRDMDEINSVLEPTFLIEALRKSAWDAEAAGGWIGELAKELGRRAREFDT